VTNLSRLLIGIVIAGAAAGGLWWWQQQKTGSGQTAVTPHFLDSTPLAGEVYAAQPINVTLNFNFDLAPGSSISVRSADGQAWEEGTAVIEDVNTALKVPLRPSMPDGSYEVRYTACWPDRSCHDGRFSFAIDSRQQSEYRDLRGQDEVTVHLNELAFQEAKIMLSPGTRVTWVNDEGVGHFVNTETHPEHTYFTPQNSRELKQGESFTVSFDTPGQYNYHCSAHVPQGMLGSILVVP
jgi:plastocyanin/methionine-rich copper-binding protein CopC